MSVIHDHIRQVTVLQDHSEVPRSDEDWPKLETIMDFQSRVRHRLLQLYDDIHTGKITLTRKIGRVLQMTYEHEALHAEVYSSSACFLEPALILSLDQTLLYMLLQRAGTGTIPPPEFTPPNWTSLTKIWEATPKQINPTVTLGPATVTLGHDDFEADDMDPVKTMEVDGHEFGWDNESPKRDVDVGEFSIDWRPITNGQFYEFYKSEGQEKVKLPATWVEYNGETCVCLIGAASVLTKS